MKKFTFSFDYTVFSEGRDVFSCLAETEEEAEVLLEKHCSDAGYEDVDIRKTDEEEYTEPPYVDPNQLEMVLDES